MSPQSVRSVHITNYYHRNSGGISTSYNALLAAAGRHERHMSLIVPGEEESVEQVNDFARIYFVPARYSPIFDKRYRIMMPWQYMVNDSIIRRILLEEKPDIVEVTDKYTLSMLGVMIRTNNFKKLGRPLLVHFSCERMDDNIGSFLPAGRLGRWFARRVISNYTLPNFDFHLANSVYTADEFFDSASSEKNPHRSKWFLNACSRFFAAPRVPLSERVHICPRGVNIELFTPEKRSAEVRREMCERAGVPVDSIVLLYAGRISPEKNVPLLVDMMKRLVADPDTDIRLLIAGAGPLESWLKKEGDRHAPGRIVLLGHLDKEVLAGYYSNADVFVHPNPQEPFGIAPLEAMASSTPTVAPNAGGILSYATNDNAWLVEPQADAFASAVREIISDEKLRMAKVERALTTARANTREASTDNLIATYERIYEDFTSRRELYTDIEASRKFDHAELLNA